MPPLLPAGRVGNGGQDGVSLLRCGGGGHGAAEEPPDLIVDQEGDGVSQLQEGAVVVHIPLCQIDQGRG